MADLLNMGTTALGALQQAITTTGHNISNSSTEGFSRQRVNFGTLPATFMGGSYVGNGMEVQSIERAYDSFLTAEVRSRTAAFSGFNTLYELSSRLDNLLADPAVGMGSAIDSFFGAVQDVANNPGSLPERQVLLGSAEAMADRFNYIDSRLATLGNEVNSRINTAISDINSLAAQIGELNGEISRASAAGGGRTPPNDLLDTRDQLIRELSQRVGLSTVQQSDGSINVMIGTGQPLVVGLVAETLEAVPDNYDSSQLVVGRRSPSGFVDDISRFITGGELGAALEFREKLLDPARNELGLVAMGITDTFNSQHRSGVDLDGQFGGDFFQPLQATVSQHAANAGTGAVTVSLDDVAGLTGDEYGLRFDAGQWTVTNLRTQASTTGAGPFSVDGMTITVGGAPANGDTFIIEPTQQASTLFGLVLTDPKGVAAASPVRSAGQLANTGSADISGLAVNDPAGLPLASPISLTFNPDALGPGVPGYDVSGIAGGPLAYDPATENGGKDFVLGDFEFSIAGRPDAGDVLLIENNGNGTGDNRNMLALADLQGGKTLLGGSASFQDAYGNLVGEVAVQTRRAETGSETENILLQQATSARDSVAGVNLDEEAANLIRYQQAYQAAAQMISVADQLFQTLLNSTGR